MIGEEVRAALMEEIGLLALSLAPDPEPREEQRTDVLVYAAPPGAGQDAIYQVTQPTLLMSAYARVHTSGVAGNRNVALEYRSADGARFLIAGANVTIPASTTQVFCWHPQAGASAWPVEDAAISPLPQQWLGYAQIVAVTVYGGDAGDLIDQVRLVTRPPGAS